MYQDDDIDDYEGGDIDFESDNGDEIDYILEIDAWDRLGPATQIMGAKPQTRAEKAAMTPLERFSVSVDAVSRSLIGNDVDISESTISYMISKASKLKKVEHKNPTAYIAGFLATDGTRKLNRENFDFVVTRVLPNIQDEESVLPVDVVRYARLWEQL